LTDEMKLYVQQLLDSPQLNLDVYARCSSTDEAMTIVHEHGDVMNRGNP
jgi:hypothetical protein